MSKYSSAARYISADDTQLIFVTSPQPDNDCPAQGWATVKTYVLSLFYHWKSIMSSKIANKFSFLQMQMQRSSSKDSLVRPALQMYPDDSDQRWGIKRPDGGLNWRRSRKTHNRPTEWSRKPRIRSRKPQDWGYPLRLSWWSQALSGRDHPKSHGSFRLRSGDR